MLSCFGLSSLVLVRFSDPGINRKEVLLVFLKVIVLQMLHCNTASNLNLRNVAFMHSKCLEEFGF